MRILLVEDDGVLAESIRDYLTPEGFAIQHASLGEHARQCVSEEPGPDLIILDWMLPDIPGVDLLRDWRNQGFEKPIILLTARTELIDRVLGLELGAEDYITKPFEPRELLARIRVQQRGFRRSIAADAQKIDCGLLSVCPSSREVRYNGSSVDLNRQEFALLLLLAKYPGRVFSREEILSRAWGYSGSPTTRTVDTHVLQVRNKTSSELIETVRGIGYRLCTP